MVSRTTDATEKRCAARRRARTSALRASAVTRERGTCAYTASRTTRIADCWSSVLQCPEQSETYRMRRGPRLPCSARSDVELTQVSSGDNVRCTFCVQIHVENACARVTTPHAISPSCPQKGSVEGRRGREDSLTVHLSCPSWCCEFFARAETYSRGLSFVIEDKWTNNHNSF